VEFQNKNLNRVVGERLCKHKYSAYCVDDIDDVVPGEECSGILFRNNVFKFYWRKTEKSEVKTFFVGNFDV
jgi:hypothetical protein